MNCDTCGGLLRKTERWEEMAEPDANATDGQLADYLAAELSGDPGAWKMGLVEYHCSKCDIWFQTQADSLMDFKALILGWHKKASEEDDCFSGFVFEYLAFIAHLKNNLYLGETVDRRVIQALKNDSVRAANFSERLRRDKHLSATMQRLIRELKERPLHNSSFDMDNPEIDKWWNSSGRQPSNDKTVARGVIRSADDWENLVELWYGVRNNLFHGGKNPNVKRDYFLAEHAYKTLKAFMDVEVANLAT